MASSCASYVFPVSRATWWADTRYDFMCGRIRFWNRSLRDCHVWPGQTYNTKHVMLEGLPRVTWTNLQHKTRDPWVTATCDLDKSTTQNTWSLSDCHVWPGQIYNTKHVILEWLPRVTWTTLQQNTWFFHDCVALFSLCWVTFPCTSAHIFSDDLHAIAIISRRASRLCFNLFWRAIYACIFNSCQW